MMVMVAKDSVASSLVIVPVQWGPILMRRRFRGARVCLVNRVTVWQKTSGLLRGMKSVARGLQSSAPSATALALLG